MTAARGGCDQEARRATYEAKWMDDLVQPEGTLME